IISLIFSLSIIASPQGTWTQKDSLPAVARGYGIGFSIGNYGYAGLGYNSGTTYNDFWRFDPSTNSWAIMDSFPGKARICPATFVIGHKAYVVTGVDGGINSLNECWVYDAITNKWTRKNDFPGPARGYDVGFAIGNKGFIGMGEDYKTTTLQHIIRIYGNTIRLRIAG